MTPITLHIGMNKTGTSALQRYCHTHRRALAEAGLCYPKAGLGQRDVGAGLHYALSQAFLTGAPDAPDLLRAVLAEVDANGAKRGLISSEFFLDLKDLAPLSEALSGREVDILVYLRRHDHWVASAFAQAIKTTAFPPWGPSVEEYVAFAERHLAHYYRYGILLDRWAAAFGASALRVRVYGPSGTQDTVSDVLAVCGVDMAALPVFVASERRNSAPSRRQLGAIDHLQRAPIPKPEKARLVRRILSRDDGAKPRQIMTAATARQLILDHDADYARIARVYLNRPDGVLFREAPPPLEGPDQLVLRPGKGAAIAHWHLFKETWLKPYLRPIRLRWQHLGQAGGAQLSQHDMAYAPSAREARPPRRLR